MYIYFLHYQNLIILYIFVHSNLNLNALFKIINYFYLSWIKKINGLDCLWLKLKDINVHCCWFALVLYDCFLIVDNCDNHITLLVYLFIFFFVRVCALVKQWFISEYKIVTKIHFKMEFRPLWIMLFKVCSYGHTYAVS